MATPVLVPAARRRAVASRLTGPAVLPSPARRWPHDHGPGRRCLAAASGWS